ncbi:MAG: 7TM-DISM domain-containing protein, partial [Saprospiraceae bacterium]
MNKIVLFFFLSIMFGTFSFVLLNAQNSKNDTASVFIIDKWQNEYVINSEVEICKDAGQISSITNIEEHVFNNEWKSISLLEHELKTYQYYWGNVLITNRLEDSDNYSEWILQFSHTLTDIDLYVEQSDGSVIKYVSGEYRPYHLKSFTPTLELNLFRVNIGSNQLVKLIFRAKSERYNVAPDFKIQLRHSTSFATFLRNRKINQYFFIGLILMLLFYHAIGAFVKKDNSFAFYCAYLFSLIVYSSNVTG